MNLTILLVDDDHDYAEVTAQLLREDGHVVAVAHDGVTARDLAARTAFDAILLDLGLPDADGYDLARALRRELPETTPIIVVTGRRDAGFAADDVDLMLNKPVPSELFGGLIEYMLRRRQHIVARRPLR